MSSYVDSGQFEVDRRAAEEAFLLVHESNYGQVKVGKAQAGTGSAFMVVVTEVGANQSDMVNGDLVVSVLEPWQRCWTMSKAMGTVTLSWVKERFAPNGLSGDVHAGDLQAVAMLIARLTGTRII